MNAIPKDKASRTFDNRFYIKKRISAGSFGVVFLCSDSVTQGYAALKVEKNEGDNLMSLDRESQILEALQGLTGFPKILWFGFEHSHNCIALQLLGKDLSYHLKQHKKFTLKTVCNIADQLINSFEEMHRRNVIHRDIKPENIITGRDGEQNLLYLVDFGISKFYKEGQNKDHIQFKEGKAFIGTTRYASISSHKGYELSRRDDIESLGYVLIFLLKGILPWQNIQTNNDKEKSKLVGQSKIFLSHAELCKDLPIEFQRFFDYVKKLTFKGQPDYKYLLQLIHKMAHSNGFVIDKKFDWIEQGTTTTQVSNFDAQQSIDTLKIKSKPVSCSKLLSQFPLNEQRSRHQSHHSKKNSNIDLSGESLFSQGDYLKPPKKKRNQERHSSVNDKDPNVSEKDSQQSSVYLNYVPSLYQKTNNKQNSLLQSIQSKQEFQNRIRHGSIQKDTLKDTIIVQTNTAKKIPLQQHETILFDQQENYQDLDAFEQRLQMDDEIVKNDYRSPKHKISKKIIIVKQIQQQSKEIRERTVSITGIPEDLMDDSPQISDKIRKLIIPIHFKQNLSRK